MDNLVALVTGASKGIGEEIARQLADAGLTVYVGSRDAARGERAVEEIGGDTRLLVLDVADDASIADAARQAATLDILVNNAGISGDGKTPDQEDAGTFRRIYETNVFGVVAVTNAFLPALRRSAHPRIVNISSGTGSLTWATDPQSRHWPGRYAAYRSSKTALNALTVFYARTLADDGIKVNALAPGLRRTDLNATAAASGGDPAEAAAGAVRLALLPDDGPTGKFFSWDATRFPGDGRHLQPPRRSGHPPSKAQICQLCVAPTMTIASAIADQNGGYRTSQSRGRPAGPRSPSGSRHLT